MHFLLLYKTSPDYLERRPQYRTEHLEMVNQLYREGHLVMAGALADPADQAVLVFRGENGSVAEDFAKRDPYVKNGLILEWTVRPWNVVVGGDQ